MMDSVSFIRSLELKKYSGLPSPKIVTLPDGKAQALVDAGSLVSFTSNLKGQQKEDVLNSSLLAQLAANKEYDRFDDSENWYKSYTDIMGRVGWVLQGFKFDQYESSEVDLKISQVTLELLSALIGDEAEMMAVVKETLDGLAKSADGITLFGSNSSSSTHGNFQVIPCTVDKSNQVSVGFLGSFFKASQVADNYFFVTMKSQDIKLFKSTDIFTLDEDLYAQVREEVIKKLGDQAKNFINDLPI